MKKPSLRPKLPLVAPEPTSEELQKPDFDRSKVKFEQDGRGPGLGQNLDEGDSITYTYGAETYTPVSFYSFTVGPFATTVRIRKGEGLEDAYLRAAKFLAQMFEAEFKIRKKQYYERMAESVKKDV